MERQGLKQSLTPGAAVATALYLVPVATGEGCPEPGVGLGLVMVMPWQAGPGFPQPKRKFEHLVGC